MTTHILILETSTQVCGVALLTVSSNAPDRLLVQEHEGSGEHAERLLPMVETLLSQANISRQQISAVAFGQGPGGFTGLRVACGVSQGLAYALNLPVIAVSSLLAVAAAQEPVEGRIDVVALDARMQELYVAAFRYQQGQWQVLHDAILLDAEYLPLWIEQIQAQQGDNSALCVHGDIRDTFPQVAAKVDTLARVSVAAPTKPSVSGVAVLAKQAFERGDTISPEQAMPIYVRDKVAFTTREREQGQGGNPSATWRPQESTKH